MQRRRFLASAFSGSVASLLSASNLARTQGTGFMPGLEAITVLRPLGRDLRGTLKAVAAIGYREIETLGSLGIAPKALRDALAECGLSSRAQHLVPDDLYSVYQRWDGGSLTLNEALSRLREGYSLDDLERIVAQGILRAQALGQRYLVWPVLFEEQVASRAALDQVVRAFNKAAHLCKDAALTFAFHNGSQASKRIGPDRVYDLLLRNTDPEVAMELDTYYAAKGGIDPLAYFAEFPNRYRLVHLKDIDSRGEITEIGRGIIDFAAVTRAARLSGVVCFYVERDQAQDPLAAARICFEAARRL